MAYTNHDKVSTGAKVGLFVFGGIVVAIIGVWFWLWGLNTLHLLFASWREGTAFWFPTLTGIAIGIALCIWGSFKSDSYGNGGGFFYGFGIVIAVIGLLAGISLGTLAAPYNMAKGYYESSTTTVEDAMTPSYEERAPYEVAVRTSDKSLMNITGDSLTTKALADEGESGEWNTLVIERGWFKGYEVVQNMNLPLYGASQNSNVKFCEFSDSATLRDGGAVPSNNLSRAIYGMVPLNVDYEASDMYSYCNDAGEPVVVVPLKEVKGFLFPNWHTYGVATYNGKTGVLEILRDAESINALPGPVYPASLAASQRNSLVANGTWWEMVGEQVSGYVAASENTEVNLRRAGEDATDYVTTLMPRGSSTSIVASSYVTATEMVPGEYNPLTVALSPDENVRPANSTLVDDLKTRYSYMPDMANDTIGVFEITAGKDGGWVASLGRDQSVNYRAYISPAGNEVKLYDRNGKLIAQGSSTSNEEGETTGVELTSTNVSELSTEELSQLGKDAMDELAKRSK